MISALANLAVCFCAPPPPHPPFQWRDSADRERHQPGHHPRAQDQGQVRTGRVLPREYLTRVCGSGQQWQSHAFACRRRGGGGLARGGEGSLQTLPDFTRQNSLNPDVTTTPREAAEPFSCHRAAPAFGSPREPDKGTALCKKKKKNELNNKHPPALPKKNKKQNSPL